ncbi:hypothetical protein [Streptomyces sp. NPDC008121]|uniref:hypothetical protein n=1 Tax=Streptomyces sp. NPDC008121 TaxID=3364809 RepID=UPI0036E8D7D3
MRSGNSLISAGARVLAVCVVLFGLFLMHGSPATAASGCSSGTESVSMPGHAAAMSPEATHGPASAVAGPGSHAQSCVSTPAHRFTLPAVAVGVVAIAASMLVLQRGQVPRGDRPLRGPPGGRSLLLQVCVART